VRITWNIVAGDSLGLRKVCCPLTRPILFHENIREDSWCSVTVGYKNMIILTDLRVYRSFPQIHKAHELHNKGFANKGSDPAQLFVQFKMMCLHTFLDNFL